MAAVKTTNVETERFLAACENAFVSSGLATPDSSTAHIIIFNSALWVAHLDAASHFLDEGESARAARFRFDSDRTIYVLAHGIWHMALSYCLKLRPDQVPLARSPAGQPFLAQTPFATSLSHSGPYVAVAICKAQTCGVDIERSPSRIQLGTLVSTFCHIDELKQLEHVCASRHEEALLDIWTRKEALLKAFGTGLLLDPTSVSVLADTIAPPDSTLPAPPCSSQRLHLPAGLIGAFAAPAEVKICCVHAIRPVTGT